MTRKQFDQQLKQNNIKQLKEEHPGSYYFASAAWVSGLLDFDHITFSVVSERPRDCFGFAYVMTRSIEKLWGCVRGDYLPCNIQ